MFKASTYLEFFNLQEFTSELFQDKTPEEIWRIPPERMEKIYQFACDLYDQARYEDAADIFLLLVTLNSKETRFWEGFGFASQQADDFGAAILAFECALDQAPYRAELYPCYLYCLGKMERKEDAVAVFNQLLVQKFDNKPQELARIRSEAAYILNKQEGG